MAEVFLLHNDKALELEKFSRLLEYVSCERKQRILKCYKIADAQRILLADILCRYVICSRLGVCNQELVFGKNEFGKPELIGHSGLHFNLSHAGKWVVLAIDDVPIGVDVEMVRPIDFGVAQRFFNEQEFAGLLAVPQECRLNYFYKVWTLKESYIKAKGKGLYINLKSFAVIAEGQGIHLCPPDPQHKWLMVHQELDKDHHLAVCAKHRAVNNLSTSLIALDALCTDVQAGFGSGEVRVLPAMSEGPY